MSRSTARKTTPSPKTEMQSLVERYHLDTLPLQCNSHPSSSRYTRRHTSSKYNRLPSTVSNPSDASFLDLPPELRLMIYALIFAPLSKMQWLPTGDHQRSTLSRILSEYTEYGGKPWQLQARRGSLFSRLQDQALAIILVNRTIYVEAAPLFYRTRNFAIPSPVHGELPLPLQNRLFSGNVRSLRVVALHGEDIRNRIQDCEFGNVHLEIAALCPALVHFQVQQPSRLEVEMEGLLADDEKKAYMNRLINWGILVVASVVTFIRLWFEVK